jgi:HEAT repeat protein
MPDPAAGEALRGALGKVKGRLLVGVINSLGQRRDAQSVEALGKLLDDPDRDVAEAASAALARIRPPL